MRLIRLNKGKIPTLGLKIEDKVLFLDEIEDFENCTDLIQMINSGIFDKLQEWVKNSNLEKYSEKFQTISNFTKTRLVDEPSKLIGIGLNYLEHASDLTNDLPKEFPTIFIKPYSVLVGQGKSVMLPQISNRVTGEAELGMVLKRGLKENEHWVEAVAGFVPIIDMTAEDILKQNTRYLGLSKIFDTFLSLGSELVTPDEFEKIDQIEVSTVLNGDIIASNIIGNMRFSLEYLVTFLSKVMTINPGDIISTGTPRATPLNHGDRIECRITGFQSLFNPVLDLKKMEL